MARPKNISNQFTKARRERHLEATRDKIQAAQIINRLYACISGKVELSAQQVAAAKVLLAKVLPDLQNTQVSGVLDHNYVARMPEQATTPEAWQEQHAPKTIQ